MIQKLGTTGESFFLSLRGTKKLSSLFKKATSIDPRNAEAWYNRDMVFCSMERYEDAVDSLEKALEIDPQSAIAGTTKVSPSSSLAGIPRPGLLLPVQGESGRAE